MREEWHVRDDEYYLLKKLTTHSIEANLTIRHLHFLSRRIAVMDVDENLLTYQQGGVIAVRVILPERI